MHTANHMILPHGGGECRPLRRGRRCNRRGPFESIRMMRRIAAIDLLGAVTTGIRSAAANVTTSTVASGGGRTPSLVVVGAM